MSFGASLLHGCDNAFEWGDHTVSSVNNLWLSAHRLQISMRNAQGMQVCNGKHQFCGVEARQVLIKDALSIELEEEMAPIDKIKDQVQFAGRLHESIIMISLHVSQVKIQHQPALSRPAFQMMWKQDMPLRCMIRPITRCFASPGRNNGG